MLNVTLTTHAVLQFQKKFPEYQDVPFKDARKLLTGAAGHAAPSTVEHYVIGQGFLEGKVYGYGRPETEVGFAYKEADDGRLIICTTLTRQEILGNGAARHD